MSRLLALLLLATFTISLGCSNSTPSNMAADASQADLDEYERLIAEADGQLAEDEESKDFGK